MFERKVYANPKLKNDPSTTLIPTIQKCTVLCFLERERFYLPGKV